MTIEERNELKLLLADGEDVEVDESREPCIDRLILKGWVLLTDPDENGVRSYDVTAAGRLALENEYPSGPHWAWLLVCALLLVASGLVLFLAAVWP